MHTLNSYVAVFFHLMQITNKLLDFVGYCIAYYQLPALIAEIKRMAVKDKQESTKNDW